jgi:hypothetical protein
LRIIKLARTLRALRFLTAFLSGFAGEIAWTCLNQFEPWLRQYDPYVDFHQMRHYAIISRFARVGCCREFFPAFVAAWSSKIRSAQIHPKQRVMSPVHEMTVSRHSNL